MRLRGLAVMVLSCCFLIRSSTALAETASRKQADIGKYHSAIREAQDAVALEVYGLVSAKKVAADSDSRESGCSSIPLMCGGSCSSLRQRLLDLILGNNKCVLIAGTCKRDFLCYCDWVGGKETEVPCDPSKPM